MTGSNASATARTVSASWLPLIVVVLTQIQASFAVNALTVSMQGITTDLDTPATSVGTAITAGTFAHTAAVFGSSQPLVDQLLAASARVDESLWQLPLERRYRPQLDSHVADISNMGGKFAGATTAALFLAHFVGGIPWAHIDIAGTMQSETDESWRPQGATGFGTRLLIDLALSFRAAS